jgi:hypothetical protein
MKIGQFRSASAFSVCSVVKISLVLAHMDAKLSAAPPVSTEAPPPGTRTQEWSTYLATAPVASQSFMEDIDDLPVQEREL